MSYSYRARIDFISYSALTNISIQCHKFTVILKQ
jgi:hypothetical protein